jgi:hypothetical protein
VAESSQIFFATSLIFKNYPKQTIAQNSPNLVTLVATETF